MPGRPLIEVLFEDEAPIPHTIGAADKPRSRNVKLTDAEWSALERIARHLGHDWGGIPCRADAIRTLIAREVDRLDAAGA